MARSDQVSRVLAVAQALARSRRGVPLSALAARHGWNLRTLYRDLAALQRAGFPIQEEEHRFRLPPDWLPPAAGGLDREELLALFVARAAAEGWRQTSLGRALDRLWSKLSAAGGRSGTLFAPDGAPWLAVRAPLGIDYARHRDAIATLETAVREGLAVTCRYAALSTGELSARVIEPGQLYWDPGLEALYVIAYCRLRRDVRVFAIHRFRLVSLLDERVPRRPEVTSKAALRHAFRVWRGGALVRVRVRFTPGRASEIRERQWHPTQRLEPTRNGGLVVGFELAGLEEVERWVLSFGADARVLEPAALVRRVSEQASATAANYTARGHRRRRRARRKKFDLG